MMIATPDFFVEHPLAMLAMTVAMTLAGKWIWDRFLSQASRVTRREFEAEFKRHQDLCLSVRTQCNLMQEKQRMKIVEEIGIQNVRLSGSEEADKIIIKRRMDTRRVLIMLLVTQQKICDHLKIDCGDINKVLIDMGMVE